VSHVEPLAVLEDQMTTYTPDAGSSPDRLDALVWALTDLMLGTTVTGDFSLVA
jgi:phage terminase large subunit-like protein